MEIIMVPNKQPQKQRAEVINNCIMEGIRNQLVIPEEITGLDNNYQRSVKPFGKAGIGQMPPRLWSISAFFTPGHTDHTAS